MLSDEALPSTQRFVAAHQNKRTIQVQNQYTNTEYAVLLGCTSLHPYLPVVSLSAYYTTGKYRIFWNVSRKRLFLNLHNFLFYVII